MDDHDECACPFCDGDVAPEVVELIMKVAAGPMARPMAIEEFRMWLAEIEPRP